MSDAMTANNDSEDLEALFDSVAKANWAPSPPVSEPPKQPDVEVQEKADSVTSPAKAKSGKKGKKKSAEHADQDSTADKMINQIGHMTRSLHESLRALGYDKALGKTAAAIPDARERLAYVARMTQQAAERVLNATDVAKPIQDQLGVSAEDLSARWDKLFSGELSVDDFKQLAGDTRSYLADVPTQTGATSDRLMEIMMAQDFQDLTGQVIKKITELAQSMEQQLLQFLVENMPNEKLMDMGLLNGPVINAEGRTDVVTSQQQVDDLLASLGF